MTLTSCTPGGYTANYDEGECSRLEVSHWSGPYPATQGRYNSSSDMVSKTLPEATATSGCQVSKGILSTSRSTPPTTTYMDYSYDPCMTQFIAYQISRMTSQRAPVNQHAQPRTRARAVVFLSCF
ncbi:hypothetical protein OF83DRAFT_1060827 [Amylostereum chailletii]|nr:hypothetical protein OF83DRAFT_1060827 [Amylostereum chailletii]